MPEEKPQNDAEAPAPAPAEAAKPARFFMNQAPMRRVVYALLPLLGAAVYFFGWRALAVVAVVYAVGIGTEYITSRQRGQAVSQACWVTCMLFALSLPPTTPFWVAAVGIVVAILFGKEVFGGFGRNFANPALVGRAFVYICFPVQITSRFVPAFEGFPGGLAHWSFESLAQVPQHLAAGAAKVVDAVSQATPMYVNREFGRPVTEGAVSLWNMAFGNISGLVQTPRGPVVLGAGSMGEGCAVLIVLAGVYLLLTKTANWRLMLSTLVGLVAATVLFRNVMGYDEAGAPLEYVVSPIEWTLLAGTTLYVTVFMVTDPISAPNRKPAQYAYGFLIGFLIVLLRWRGIFVAAATFAVLLGNIVGPLFDIAATAYADRKRARRKAAKEGQGKGKGAEKEGQGKDDVSKHGHPQTTGSDHATQTGSDHATPAEGGAA